MIANSASIPSSYSRLIARILNLNERNLNLLLRFTNISKKQFLKEELMITAQQQIQILQNALLLSKTKSFGLELGKNLTPPTHGTMGFLANSSPNFLTAIKAIQTYSQTRMNFIHLKVVIEEDFLECYLHIDIDVSTDIQRCLSEAAVMSFFECAKFIIGRDIEEATTFLSFHEPEYSQDYQKYLSGRIQFDSSHSFVRVPLSLCLIPNISANNENYLLALSQCEMMLSQLLSSKDSYKYMVQKIMLSSPLSQLNEERIAEELFINKRTLARRLKKERTSFRELRDEILSQQAADYLIKDELSIDAIAMLLNYHDSSNFRRAFKRWFGMSPDQFRKSKFKQ